MNNSQLYQVVTTLILAGLLFFPVSKIIWVLSVRRLQRKKERELDQQELQGQLTRARFISVILVLIFAYLFNSVLLGKLAQ